MTFKQYLKEIGEMSKDSILPDGEYYEWAKSIEDAVKRIEKETKGKLKFVEMKPFDKYQGPYAYVKINGKADSVWSIGEDLDLYIETMDISGDEQTLIDAINGDENSLSIAKKNAENKKE